MNIVIFGGGTVGKMGNDIALRARKDNHRVIIFSHQPNNTNDSDQYVIDYTDLEKSKETIDRVMNSVDKIDVLYFNQVGGSYPSGHELLSEPILERYNHTWNSHIILLHLVLTRYKNKIVDGSKVFNMTTSLAFQYEKTHEFLAGLVGYSAGKSCGTHLIQAYSKLRENKAIYFTLSPSVNYESQEVMSEYPEYVESLYKFILNATEDVNGKIFSAYKANENHEIKILIR